MLPPCLKLEALKNLISEDQILSLAYANDMFWTIKMVGRCLLACRVVCCRIQNWRSRYYISLRLGEGIKRQEGVRWGASCTDCDTTTGHGPVNPGEVWPIGLRYLYMSCQTSLKERQCTNLIHVQVGVMSGSQQARKALLELIVQCRKVAAVAFLPPPR